MKKICLVVANSGWFGMRKWNNPMPSVPIITAILKPLFDFKVVDANGEDLSEADTKERIKASLADVILITALSTEYHMQYHKVAEIAKEALPGSKVIMGGVHPTVMPEEVISDKNIDYLFIGYAEERLDKFITLLVEEKNEQLCEFEGIGYRENEKTVINPFRKNIGDLKTMVKPDYSETNLNLYFERDKASVANFIIDSNAAVMTSYGCPYNCIFCATRTISGHKVAYRSIEDVLEEIEYLIRQYDVKVITFTDDCLLTDRQRAVGLFQKIIDNKYNIDIRIGTVAAWQLDNELLVLMKEAGCSRFGISVESGCDRVLKEIIHKPLKKEIIPPIVEQCRELGILMTANFVIGFPGETWDEIRESLKFAEVCNFDLINIHIATVLPETDLYRLAVKENLLPENFSFFSQMNFGFGKGNLTTDEFTPEELEVIRAYEWDRINFSSAEKVKRACTIMNITEEQLKEHRKQTRIKCGKHF